MQRLALDVFHHKVENALRGFPKVTDAHCIRMLDRRGGLSLAFEPCDRFAFLQVLAAQQILSNGLDGKLFCRELCVLCEIDLSHRTAAEPALEQVTPGKDLTSGQRVLCRGLITRTGQDLVRVTKLTFRTFSHLDNYTEC